MNAKQLYQRLLRSISLDQPGSAPDYIKQDVVQAVNGGLQILWTDVPRDKRSHYTRKITQLAVLTGVSSYTIPSTQGVLSPTYWLDDECSLTRLSTKGEALAYHDLLGIPEHGRPTAIYEERLSGESEPSINVILRPTPLDDETLILEVESAPVQYTLEDFCLPTPPAIPLPNDYIETLLLPIALYLMATSSWFDDKDKLPLFKEQYNRALLRAGVTDPQNLGADAGHETRDE